MASRRARLVAGADLGDVTARWRRRVEAALAQHASSPAVLRRGRWRARAAARPQRFEPLPPDDNLARRRDLVRARRAQRAARARASSGLRTGTQTALHGPLTSFSSCRRRSSSRTATPLQRATMALVGALAVVMIAYVARELAGPRVGLVAAVLAAVYPGLWVNDLVATSESPAVLLLAAILLPRRCATAATRRPRRLVLHRADPRPARARPRELVPARAPACRPGLRGGRASARRAPWRAVVRSLLVVGVLAVAVVAPWSIVQPAPLPPDGAHLERPRPDARRRELSRALLRPAHGLRRRRFYLGAPARDAAQGLERGRRRRLLPARRRSPTPLHHWHALARRRGPARAVAVEPVATRVDGVHVRRLHRSARSGSRGPRSWRSGSSRPFAFYGFVLARRRRIPVAPLVTLVAFTAALGLLVVGHLRYRIPAELAWVLLGAIAIDRARARGAARRRAPRRGVSRRSRSAGAAGVTALSHRADAAQKDAASSATNVTPADHRNATLKPDVTAARASRASGTRGTTGGGSGPSRETAWLVATVASSARPSEPPTWRDVLRIPDAKPASCGATVDVAAAASGLNRSPSANATAHPAA